MLNLCANNIGGLFPPQELVYLGNLERLDLSSIQFNDIQGESVTNLQLGSMAIVHSQSSSFMRSMPLVFEDCLTKSSALYSLNIERCSITSRTIQKVADSLGSESVLSQICLGYNNPISSNAIVNLLAKLASLKRFSELNLNGLKLSKHVVDGLCQLSQTSCLSPMMLGDTSIGNDGALQLIESLSNGTHELMKLDLSSCGLTSQYIFRLNDEVSLTSSIVDLNLRGNQIMQEELLLRELLDAEVLEPTPGVPLLISAPLKLS